MGIVFVIFTFRHRNIFIRKGEKLSDNGISIISYINGSHLLRNNMIMYINVKLLIFRKDLGGARYSKTPTRKTGERKDRGGSLVIFHP